MSIRAPFRATRLLRACCPRSAVCFDGRAGVRLTARRVGVIPGAAGAADARPVEAVEAAPVEAGAEVVNAVAVAGGAVRRRWAIEALRERYSRHAQQKRRRHDDF